MSVLAPLSDLHYVQWMMIAGGVFVVIGFLGFALIKNRSLQPEVADDASEQDDQSKATDMALKTK